MDRRNVVAFGTSATGESEILCGTLSSYHPSLCVLQLLPSSLPGGASGELPFVYLFGANDCYSWAALRAD